VNEFDGVRVVNDSLYNMELVNEGIFMRKQHSSFDFATVFLKDDSMQPIDE
jgi:hypothetical protein